VIMKRIARVVVVILVALLVSCAAGQEVDKTPPVISGISTSSITGTGAAITWITDKPATSQVEYGPTASYGAITTLDETLVTSHSVNLSGLTPGTTYHYRVKSKDASRNEAVSADQTITTLMQLGLDEAETMDLVETTISGSGLTSITLQLQSTSTGPLNVLVLPGTIFEAQSADVQDMVVTEAREALLSSYGSSEMLSVPAACANMHLDAPESSDTFTIRRAPTSEDLLKLLSVPGFIDGTLRVQQFAIWTITENPNCRANYRGLGTWGFGSGPSEEEMERIETLFEKAEISTDKYPALGGTLKDVQATIVQVSLTWGYGDWGYYSLDNVEITIRNDTQFPIDIDEARLTIDGKQIVPGIGEIILPGEEKTIARSIYVTEVGPGERTLSLELRDPCDVVVGIYSSKVTPVVAEETQFQLTDWAVIDHYNTASLQLSFTITGDVELLLTNPDGVEVDSERVYYWGWDTEVEEKEAELDLAGYKEIPEAGQYTLTVKDALGKIIDTEIFSFAGGEVTMSEVSLTWDYDEYWNSYSLKSISFKVTNNGDLPAYIDEGKITVDSETQTLYFYETILPDEEATLYSSIYAISEITAGTKTFTLELKDNADKIIAFYSTTVTPSA
jgi:hypothetical protein